MQVGRSFEKPRAIEALGAGFGVESIAGDESPACRTNGKCKQRQHQIPFGNDTKKATAKADSPEGNDRKKGKSKGKSRSFAVLRMTMWGVRMAELRQEFVFGFG